MATRNTTVTARSVVTGAIALCATGVFGGLLFAAAMGM